MGAPVEHSKLRAIGRFSSRLIPAFALGIWGLLLVAGLGWLWAYDASPGVQNQAPRAWLANQDTPFVNGKYNLLAFVHAGCPCSRATLGELARLMAKSGAGISATVYVTRFPGELDDAEDAGLLELAQAIPGVHGEVDERGAQARRFAAASSGQILLYNLEGRLVFSGGITGARGHFGDNDGEDAILALVAHEKPKVDHTPVYGCALFNEPIAHSNERWPQ